MTQICEQPGRRTSQRSRRPTLDPALVRLRKEAPHDIASGAGRIRRVPKQRRNFPPLEPGREAILRERNRAALADEPRRVELERRLLDLGGIMALLFLPDHQIGDLLDRGRFFPGSGARIVRGADSACHSNAALQFVQTEGGVLIASGYALSPDGPWRQHSWGVDAKDGRVVETTERRVRCFGFVLSESESLFFLMANLPFGDLVLEEVEAVREFIAWFYDLPAELRSHSDRVITERTGVR
jgi:hypothetical protein